MGFLEERPGAFRKIPRKGSNVEGDFSSMKERFGGVARAARAKTRAAELSSTRACHNMAFA